MTNTQARRAPRATNNTRRTPRERRDQKRLFATTSLEECHDEIAPRELSCASCAARELRCTRRAVRLAQSDSRSPTGEFRNAWLEMLSAERVPCGVRSRKKHALRTATRCVRAPSRAITRAVLAPAPWDAANDQRTVGVILATNVAAAWCTQASARQLGPLRRTESPSHEQNGATSEVAPMTASRPATGAVEEESLGADWEQSHRRRDYFNNRSIK